MPPSLRLDLLDLSVLVDVRDKTTTGGISPAGAVEASVRPTAPAGKAAGDDGAATEQAGRQRGMLAVAAFARWPFEVSA